MPDTSTIAGPMRILLTGFEPFDGHTINVSWEVARTLNGRRIAGATADHIAQIVSACVPCRFGACIDELERLLSQHQPQIALCLGQAEGRADITVERVALNVRDARIPDNGGNAPVDEPVSAEGPFAYPSRLPVRELVTQLRRAGHPVSISNSAGTFVCNDLFYGLMHLTQHSALAAGFIHLPILPEQRRQSAARSADRDDAPHMFNSTTPAIALTDQLAAIEAALELTVRSLNSE
jgi:pyroglutamyl-peptidase